MVAQRGGRGVVGEVGIPAGEAFRQLRVVAVVEVHDQAGDVVEAVEPAQPVVEVEAVEHPGSVVEAEDVVGEEIPVPVEDPVLGDPALEQRFASREEVAGAALDLGHQAVIEDVTPEGLDVVEVLLPPRADRVPAPLGGDLLGPVRAGVELGDQPGDLVHDVVDPVPCVAGEQRGEPPRAGHPPHHHRVLAGLPVGVVHVHHPEVHVGGEPAVELHLPPGGPPAGLPRREVQEAQIHRLLQLVGTVAQEHHRPGVGLRRRDVRGRDVRVAVALVSHHVPAQPRTAA